MTRETRALGVCIGRAVLVLMFLLCAGCGLFWPKQPVNTATTDQVQRLEAKVEEGTLTIRQLEQSLIEQSQATTKTIAEKIDTVNQNTENHFNDLSDNQLKQAEGTSSRTWGVVVAVVLLCIVLPSGPFWFRITLLILAVLILLGLFVALPLMGVLL